MTPTISTSRLSLRPLGTASQRQVNWLRDPDVVKYSEQRHKPHTLSTQMHYIRSFGGKSHIWAIYHLESGDHIGNVTAACDEPNNVSDVGIMIGETKYWGKGYGVEAWVGACTWLLDPAGGDTRRLEAGCMAENAPMLRIMGKSRFVQEGIRSNRFLLDGRPVSCIMFGRMR